ncbi:MULTISPECIES: hypothetical protein [Streptomycetaceae]|uniref:hypothetical protein n=1 Tax=Streptomycetaceae TaxID=2062 RepID=UPI00300AF6A7
MGRAPDEPGETPAQKKQRANDLRDCARDARTIAGSLGPYLDSAVAQANSGIWKGPYAETTTAMLGSRKSTLHQMASDLVADAKRWENAAQTLEDEAAKGAH